MSREETLEDALVAYLQGNANFIVKVCPEVKDEFSPSQNCKVFLYYNASDYNAPDSLGETSQNEKVQIGVEFHCLNRRGNVGILSAKKYVFEKLLGYKLPGYDKLYLISFGPLEGSGPGAWKYFALFGTNTWINENLPEPVEINLNEVTIV